MGERSAAKRGGGAGGPVRAGTLKRLFGLCLRHFPILFALLISTAIYSAMMTARVAVVYPLMRVFAQDLTPEEKQQAEAQGLPVDEMVKHTLTKQDGNFSGMLDRVNHVLDLAEGWFVDKLEPVLPEEVLASPAKRARVGVCAVVASMFIGIIVISALSNFAKHYFSALLVVRVLTRLRVRLLENLLHQPLAFYNEQKRGELISRMSADVGATTVCTATLTGPLLLQPMQVLMPVVAIVAVKWWLFIIVAGFLAAIARSLFKQTRKVHRRARVRQRTTARVTEAMVQMFSGIRVVKAFGLEGVKVEQYSQRNEEFARDAMATEVAKGLTRTRMELLTNLALLLVVVVIGLVSGGGGSMPAGALIAIVAMLSQIYRPAKVLTQSYTDLMDNLAGADRTFEFMDLRPGLVDRIGARPLPPVEGTVRFEDVSFSYNGNGRVLHHVDLEVPAGKVVAFVGHSGAGKSTLVNLVPRFYDPDEGRITIDGHDVRDIKRESLLRNIAIVTQEPFLFNTSILENIAHGKPDATNAEIEAAAQAANIHDFILSLPRRYETVVGDQGAKLSGGQRQRITIARALLRDARILILDEATSSLDTESERVVQDALENLMKGRTTLVIAHRLSTVQHADLICVMQDGRIVETGTNDELLARDSLYRRLYELQFGTTRVEPAAL